MSAAYTFKCQAAVQPRQPGHFRKGAAPLFRVAFKLELTTPACPIKDEFERKARDYVSALPWVSEVRPDSPYSLKMAPV